MTSKELESHIESLRVVMDSIAKSQSVDALRSSPALLSLHEHLLGVFDSNVAPSITEDRQRLSRLEAQVAKLTSTVFGTHDPDPSNLDATKPTTVSMPVHTKPNIGRPSKKPNPLVVALVPADQYIVYFHPPLKDDFRIKNNRQGWSDFIRRISNIPGLSLLPVSDQRLSIRFNCGPQLFANISIVSQIMQQTISPYLTSPVYTRFSGPPRHFVVFFGVGIKNLQNSLPRDDGREWVLEQTREAILKSRESELLKSILVPSITYTMGWREWKTPLVWDMGGKIGLEVKDKASGLEYVRKVRGEGLLLLDQSEVTNVELACLSDYDDF